MFPRDCLIVCRKSAVWFFSSATFTELENRIWSPKFDRYLPIERRRRLLLEANACALWVAIPARLASRRHSRNARDDMFIHAALAASTARLVSEDDDLLCLHPLDGLHILTPRAALDELAKLGGS